MAFRLAASYFFDRNATVQIGLQIKNEKTYSGTFLLLVQKKSTQKRRRRAKSIAHSEGSIGI